MSLGVRDGGEQRVDIPIKGWMRAISMLMALFCVFIMVVVIHSYNSYSVTKLCMGSVPISVSWLCYCAVVTEKVTTRGKLDEGYMEPLCTGFGTICESIII